MRPWKNREAYDVVTAARVLLASPEKRPYLAAAIYGAIFIEAPDCPSVGIDKHMRIYFNPKMVVAWGVKVMATVLYHEISHTMRQHLQRWEHMGVTEVTHPIANASADAELNDDIDDEIKAYRGQSEALEPIPKSWFILPEDIKAPRNRTMEEYYDRIMKDPALAEQIKAAHSKRSIVLTDGGRAKSTGNGQWESDCGGGVTGVPAKWELGPPEKSGVEGLESADIFDIRMRVAGAVRAASRGRGKVPGRWTEWSDDLLAPAPVRWEDELGEAVRRTLYEVSGFLFATYARLSRRASACPDIVLPSWRRPCPEVVTVEDTSGSMGKDDLALVRGTVEAICQAHGAAITSVQCDSQVRAVVQRTTGRSIEFLGRGGTDMRVGIAAALALQPKPDVVMVITDGESPWPEDQTEMNGARLIIALVRPRPREILDWAPPDWARVIEVHPGTEKS